MYNEIETEFAPKFEALGIDFMSEYLLATHRVRGYHPDIAKNAIKSILSEVLAEYARSQGHTKVGRILRFISRIFAPIIKVFKG